MSDNEETPVTKFVFTTDRIEEAAKDLDLQIDAYVQRIDKLVKSVEVNHYNVIGPILNLTHDQELLIKLGETIKRIAPLIAKHDELEARKAVFDLAKRDPNWLQWAFGDFSQEIREFVDRFEANPPEG